MPDLTLKPPVEADTLREVIGEVDLNGVKRPAGNTKSGCNAVSAISPVTQNVAGPKAAHTMKTSAATGEEGSLGGIRISTVIIPMSGTSISTIVMPGSPVSLSQLVDMYRSRSGFYFESSDAPGTGMRLMSITPSAPEIRILSNYQTEESRESVPLPPAVLLLVSGLAACIAVEKYIFQNPRTDYPAA